MSINIKIKGIGLTKFGELWNISGAELIKEATDTALENAGLTINEIDEVYIGTMLTGTTMSQGQIGSIISSIYNVNIPAFRIEGACASGGLAAYQAIQSIKAQKNNTVLVIGVEKMTDYSSKIISKHLMQAASEEERLSGATFQSLYALMAKAHMEKYGSTREQAALASLIAHKNAAKTPYAQFKNPISVEDVINSTPVAEPLCLLDCSPITDGAATIILSNEKPDKSKKEAFLIDQICTSDSLSLSDRKSITEIESAIIASKKIFKQNNLTTKDIDIIEVHDCFSISTLIALEDMGFAEKGKGGEALEKILNEDKNLPALNTSGGLKASGHPVGATGIKQIAEIALQLQENAGERQIDSPKYGLTHNIGGTGATCVMHLLSCSPT